MIKPPQPDWIGGIYGQIRRPSRQALPLRASPITSTVHSAPTPSPLAGPVISSFATFLLAIAVVVLWGASGPIFEWSDTWQLVINTATTIVTFLMVFVIQNTQMRDTQAMQLKLDELIRVNTAARNSFISLEEMSEADVGRMRAAFTAFGTIEPAAKSTAGESGPAK
jgi:low affinity Fe/Cu permease